MSAAITSLIAVAGTLLGVLTTQLFQRNTTKRAELFAQRQRIHEERLATLSAFARAATEYRRTQYDRWHRQDDSPDSPEHLAAKEASYQNRSAASLELFRLQMLITDETLLDSAEATYDLTARIQDASTEEELKSFGESAKGALQEFVLHAQEFIYRTYSLKAMDEM
ncbi:hypothetical protein GWI34_18320 [Actinomadura sp. DSM 109109]|nr:hypothetical protein [Actinomadura lepetitiana]